MECDRQPANVVQLKHYVRVELREDAPAKEKTRFGWDWTVLRNLRDFSGITQGVPGTVLLVECGAPKVCSLCGSEKYLYWCCPSMARTYASLFVEEFLTTDSPREEEQDGKRLTQQDTELAEEGDPAGEGTVDTFI